MTAKQYLRQLSRIELNIQILSEEIERRRTKLESTTVATDNERVQTSGFGDRFAEMIAALADKEHQQEDLLYIYQTMRDKIVEQIRDLDNSLYASILYLRYVQEESMRDISEKMHYEYKYLCRLHGKALMAFSVAYPDILAR